MITSADEFVELRSSENSVEYNRAAHDEISDEAIRQIIEKYPDYIEWVVHNKSVPEWVLIDQSDSPNARIRLAIATKRKCPEPIMLKLSSDEDESVRHAIALNPKATMAVLDGMVNDEWDVIRDAVRKRKGEIE